VKIACIGGGPAGLYFGILMKRADPRHEIDVYERNAPDDTFGWGVVFSDATLENLEKADPESYREITGRFAKWDAIDVWFKGEVIRSGGHGFCGISRRVLLNVLQARAAELGVRVHYRTEVREVPKADLVVACDGINSFVRARHADVFRPTLDVRKAKYIWLGTTRPFEAFTFFVKENEHGFFQTHCYAFDGQTSTFIAECDEESWRRAGLDRADAQASVDYLERLFREELRGHRLLVNKSEWISFRTVRNERWRHGNVVLMGDAAHTAHFSIGSGTKLAMEDAISLARELSEGRPLDEALARYEEERKWYTEKLQKLAQDSLEFFEELRRCRDYEPLRFAYALLTRSRKITHDNLKRRDPAFIERVEREFARKTPLGPQAPATPPMFTPFRLRDLLLPNRIVVSPMCMYSADDGLVNDWHLVHLGSRAIGGAGLVMTEMTDVSREGRITPGCAGIYRTEHVKAWRRIVDFVHRFSRAKIGMQIAHAGRKGSVRAPWQGGDKPLADGNWELLAPSARPFHPHGATPREMDRADMERVRDDFVRATAMAEEAGFDIVEVHMAHGYLLSSFLSPLSNRRTDGYGGSLAARMRFPLEVFEAMRARWPAEKPMSVRISAHDWVPGGFAVEEAVELAKALRERGCDVVDVSSGFNAPEAMPEFGPLFQLPFSVRVRNEARVPTITVGGVSRHGEVNAILASGGADLCAIARGHLFDPYFTVHAAAQQEWYDFPWPDQYAPAKPQPRPRLRWLDRK